MSRRFIWLGGVLEPPLMEARVGRICLEVGDDGILGYGGGCPPGAADTGADTLLMPGLCNAHIHLPDAAIADAGEYLDLHELVAQPHGLKYRLLASIDIARAASAVRDIVEAYRSEGTLVLIAYAEPGLHNVVDGVMLGDILVRVAAQPSSKRLSEAMEAVSEGYWVGLDTPLDMEAWELRLLSSYAESRGGQVIAHVSEDEALAKVGDLEAAMDGGVHVLVHMTHASPGAVLEAAMAGASIVYCPAANLYFTGETPDPRGLIALFDAEAPVGLGSDNAAWPPQGVAWLLATAYTLYRAKLSGSAREALARALLYAATIGCGKVAKAETGWQIRRVPLLQYTTTPIVGVLKRLHHSVLEKVVETPRPAASLRV